mgnify:CR=1 FL=1
MTATREAKNMTKYQQVQKHEVPNAVRFDVPLRNQGQIIEIAYGGFGRAEHDDGDPYKRVHDRSDGTITYYRLAKAVRP